MHDTDLLFAHHAQLLLEAVGDGLVVVDARGAILTSCGPISQRLGLDRGGHFPSLLPELWSVFAALLQGPETPRSGTHEGGGFLARMSRLEHQGRLLGGLCLFLENDAAGRDFEKLAGELDAIIDSCSDGLLICEADGTVLRINPASQRINGVSAEEVVGRNMRDLLQQGVFESSAGLEAVRTGEKVSLLQSSRGRKLIFTATPVCDSEGRVVRAVVCENDISEIDRLQRQLEEQAAIKDQLSDQILAMQLNDLENRQVVARSPGMIRAVQQAMKVSKADSSVLILGESGVGKGLIAELIHKNSPRAARPMIRINCGAIPDSLIESELFGYEKGAFTGAESGKPGHFELADGGILFLDEIAELPLSSQVKLLRFLEDGRITRLGSTQGRTVNVRILAATHRNLDEMVEQGRFRHDLYYRLNVIPLTVPAVRERKECILPLIRHYLDFFGEKNGLKRRLSQAASEALQNYAYPGNVRELMNVCERLVVMAETELIDLADLPSDIVGSARNHGSAPVDWCEGVSLQQALDRVELRILSRVMEQFSNQTDMAAALGVTQATIARKLQKYGLKRGRRLPDAS
ncbi:MAG TPA: sigma 54-interacting transcriptional regulator [Geopsychrobacteraceae bacterium]